MIGSRVGIVGLILNIYGVDQQKKRVLFDWTYTGAKELATVLWWVGVVLLWMRLDLILTLDQSFSHPHSLPKSIIKLL